MTVDATSQRVRLDLELRWPEPARSADVHAGASAGRPFREADEMPSMAPYTPPRAT